MWITIFVRFFLQGLEQKRSQQFNHQREKNTYLTKYLYFSTKKIFYRRNKGVHREEIKATKKVCSYILFQPAQ